MTPDEKKLCVTNCDAGTVRVVRRSDAFVSAMDDNRVVEVDVSTGRVLQKLSTGKGPEGLAWVGSR